MPREERLLNGLRLLVWEDKSADKTMIKIRINRGAAFDLKDKAGMMALLGDILFPDEQTKKFFREDFRGGLNVHVGYDYIQVDANGKTENFLAMLEILANGIINTPITKENFRKVQEARLLKISQQESNNSYLADLVVVERLLGSFPYGRSVEGRTETLKRIELADLVFAKNRYLTADNSTMVVVSNLKADFVYMAVRRIFGGWKKSEVPVPYTFRQPDEPDQSPLMLKLRNGDFVEVRSATRGLARSDPHYFVAEVLAEVLSERLKSRVSSQAAVFHQAHILPGVLLMKASIQPEKAVDLQKFTLTVLVNDEVSFSEFERAKAAFLERFRKYPIYELWLDIDTYKLVSVKDELQKAENVSLEEVRRLLEDFRKRPIVNVVFLRG